MPVINSNTQAPGWTLYQFCDALLLLATERRRQGGRISTENATMTAMCLAQLLETTAWGGEIKRDG